MEKIELDIRMELDMRRKLSWIYGEEEVGYEEKMQLKGQCHEIFCFRFFS
jgi:hypothetical protein